MEKQRFDFRFGDLSILLLLAVGRVLISLLTNSEYGFHRDELAMIDNARRLAWGFVEYPPLAPFVARVSLVLFGPSSVGVRYFAAVAQGAAMVLGGLITKELGGSRRAQILAALAIAISPVSVAMGAMFQYTSFDYLWWVLVAYFMVRLLKSDDPRWWLGIGAAIGLGLMTKYAMAFLVAGVVLGVLLTPARRYLRSPWLWGGVALALLIFLPNLVWQVQHRFISLEFLSDIHARDVRIGRSSGFLVEQFFLATNPVTVPLWLAGLYFYALMPAGRRYRPLAWMYTIPLVLLLVTKGRGYYLAPAYPMLMAAGAVVWDQWLASLPVRSARIAAVASWGALVAGTVLVVLLVLPVAPVNSPLWKAAAGINGDLVEQVGWPELVERVADVYGVLTPEEREGIGILAGNYGEAGAINLYGPEYGLPRAISGINTYWLAGYGDPPPKGLLVLGLDSAEANRRFGPCRLVGRITNRENVANEETTRYPGVLYCRAAIKSWPEFWKNYHWFG